jgi:flagellar hook-associated protein 2
MMSAEQLKIDKADKAKQVVEWKQEAYQDIIKDIKELQSTFFDSTSSDKNILSPTNYAGFNVTDEDSGVANITAGVGAQTGSYTISVASLATKASTNSSSIVKDASATYDDANWNDKKIGISINGGTVQTITLANSDKLLADRISEINNQIQSNSTLKGKVQAVATTDNKNTISNFK